MLVPFPHKERGFTLTEISLVVLILTVLVGLSLSVGATRLDAHRMQLTNQRMAYIEAALILYAHNHEHLPCPADPEAVSGDAGAGVGTGTNTDGTCSAANITSCPIACGGPAYHGVIPYKTLGIPEQAALDGWDNKIGYGVSANLTFVGQK